MSTTQDIPIHIHGLYLEREFQKVESIISAIKNETTNVVASNGVQYSPNLSFFTLHSNQSN